MKKYLKCFVIVLAMFAIVFGLASCGGGNKDSDHNDSGWKSFGKGCGAIVPEPILPYIVNASTSYISVDIYDASVAQYENYVNVCRDAGFEGKIKFAESPSYYFNSTNSQGYKLQIYYYSDDSRISIYAAPPTNQSNDNQNNSGNTNDNPNDDNKNDESDNKGDNNNNNNNNNNNGNNNQNSDSSIKAAAVKDANAVVSEFSSADPLDYITPYFIIDSLVNLGYSEDVAAYAMNNCTANWSTQARKCASNYLLYEEEFGRPASWWTESEIKDILREEGFSTSTINTVLSQVVWSTQKELYLLHLLNCTSVFYENIPNRYEAAIHLIEYGVVATETVAYQLINNISFDWGNSACAMALQTWNENGGEAGKTVEEIIDLLERISGELSDVWGYTYSEIENAMSQFDKYLETESYSVALEYTAINGGYAVSGLGDCTDKKIIIPDTYNKKKVTRIDDDAFWNCTSLTSVIIGNGVTSIGSHAFADCTNLTSVVIPDSVTSISERAFSDCTSLKSLVIPDGVTCIGDYAFYKCYSLTNVVIPDSTMSIGNGAFYSCDSLTSIAIPDNVTSIGWGAFYDCFRLTIVTIGNGVTSIGEYAFWGCVSLESVTIGNGVTSIGTAAFCQCDSLTSVTIGNGVKSIGESAFCHCDSLKSVIIGNSVTSIGDSAFSYCKNLTIYCEATSQPSGWDSNWNSSNRPVVWGYVIED